MNIYVLPTEYRVYNYCTYTYTYLGLDIGKGGVTGGQTLKHAQAHTMNWIRSVNTM